jgi:hypothetical protein
MNVKLVKCYAKRVKPFFDHIIFGARQELQALAALSLGMNSSVHIRQNAGSGG